VHNKLREHWLLLRPCYASKNAGLPRLGQTIAIKDRPASFIGVEVDASFIVEVAQYPVGRQTSCTFLINSPDAALYMDS
jgi:hypothetical protein